MPRLARGPRPTVAAVWTASTDERSDVYIAISADGGVTFGAPVRVNDVDGDAERLWRTGCPGAGWRESVHVLWPAKRAGVG